MYDKENFKLSFQNDLQQQPDWKSNAHLVRKIEFCNVCLVNYKPTFDSLS